MLAVGAWLGAFVGAFGVLPPSVSGPPSSYVGQHLGNYAGAYFGGIAGAVVQPPGPDPQPPEVVSIEVPYLIGKTAAVAADRIVGAGFTAFVMAGVGTVTAQDPPAFVRRPRGSAVTVTLGGIIRGAPSRRKRGLPPYQTPESYK